ncbi:MAG: glycosyltransferase [Deltaproteobacteria bacterium]|nr:glycosyltransferase [Deltaproteobacteria bacterium]
MSSLISVVTPFFQTRDTLPFVLQDLQAQTHRDWEWVAVADGDEDGGAEWLEHQARSDTRLRIVRLPKSGIVTALNTGLALCRGEFVARMDADDRMHPDRLSAQRQFLLGTPDCDLVGSYVLPFSWTPDAPSAGMVRYHNWMNRFTRHEEIIEAMLVESPLAHPSFFARRRFFEALGGYHARPWPEDYDLLLRAWRANARFGKVPRVLVRRGDRPGRLTRTDPIYRREGMYRAKAHHLLRGPWGLRPAPGAAAARPIVVCGSGPAGRMAAQWLREEGAEIAAFQDAVTAPSGRTVMGRPAHGFPNEIPAEFFREFKGALFLSCMGKPEERGRLIRQLNAAGLKQGQDWLAL